MPLDPELEPHLTEAARLNNLDPQLLRALLAGESSFNPNATSGKGAQGIAQIIPSTAKQYGIDDPLDPVQGIYGGARIFNDALTNAEQLKASGRDIVPVEYALKTYFAGPEGPQWGPKTAAYPGYIASKYQAASKQPGGVEQLAASGSQDDNQGSVASSPGMSPSDQALAQIMERRRLANNGDTSRPAPDNAPWPSTGGMTKSPGVADGDNGQPYIVPAQFAQERAAQIKTGAGMDGIDQLAAAGQPQPAGDMPPGVMQLAQAAGQPGMSDEELLKGFVDGTLPFMQKPTPAASPAPGPAAGAPVASGAPTPPVAASANTPAPTSPVALADPTAALYPPALRQHLMTFPEGQQTLAKIIDEEKAGFQRNRDGTFSPIKGGPADPSTAWQTKAGETAGAGLQSIGPNGVAPLPGAAQSAQTMANAKSEGEQGPVRQTQAIAPQQQRGAGSSITYPLGSPVAKAYGDLQKSGALPQGVTVDPSGTVTIANMNPASETIGKNFETLDKMEAESTAARLGLYQAQLLKDRLAQIGTSGPATQSLGALASWAQQAGVPPETLKKFALPEGANVEQANSLALGLLGEGLRATFPQRITNTDISTFKPSSPNVNMLSDASNYLIDKVVVPKMTRDIERYGYATSLPQNDPQEFKSSLFKWDQDHPYSAYAQANAPAPKRLIWNPTTNALEPAKQ